MYFLAMPLHFKRHLNQRSRDMKLSNKKISLLKGAKARVVTRKLKANKLSKKEQNKIVEDHIALAGFIAKKYLGSREPYEDLVQIGVEGLIKAAARFNKGYGVKFSTYAGPTIEGEIRHYLRDKVSGVKVSRKLLELNGKIRKFVNQFEQTNGYTPQTKQIAKAMKMKETKLVKAIKLSKMTMRGIKQNLFWAFIYNIVGIPLAGGLFYPIFGWLLSPVFAGFAMAMSSVSVVSNSLRIKTKKL
jgi:RNA polymerase sigma factor (sigma-70 family)